MPACRMLSANTISTRPKPASSSRTSPSAASSTSSAAAAARRPITFAPSPSRSRACPRARFPTADGRPSFKSPHTQFAGLEVLPIRPDSNFQMIGERTNVTGSKKFQRLIKDGKFGEAVDVALEQVRGGANLIDVNMDEGLLDSEQAMTHFLNLIATEPEISRLPIMIDSSKWSVLEAGLKCVQGKAGRQLDQPERRRRRLPEEGASNSAVRRGRGRHGVRRDRPGRHHRAQGRDLQAGLYAAHREARLRPDRHHLRPEHPGDCDGTRRAQRVRHQLHRGVPADQSGVSRA